MWTVLQLALASTPLWSDDHQLVDAVGWAASDRSIRRLLRDASGPDGSYAESLRPDARRGRDRRQTLLAAEAELIPDGDRWLIHVREGLVYTHRPREPVTELVLRLFPAGEHVFPDAARVLDVRVDGQPAVWTIQGTLLVVSLQEPLHHNDRSRVLVDFAAELPPYSTDTSKVERIERLTAEEVGSYGFNGDHIQLGGFLAVPTAWRDGAFDRRPLPINGEYAMGDPMNIHLVFDGPDPFTAITTGIDIDRTSSQGRSTVIAVAAESRDMMVVLGKGLTTREIVFEGFRLNVHAGADEPLLIRQITRWAATAVEVLEAAYGPLSIAELDVVETPLHIAQGAEFPGLVLVDATPNGEIPDEIDLGTTVAHEVAHQWWSAEVGSDARDEPWLDEALAAHGAALVIEHIEGPQVMNRHLKEQAEASLQALVEMGRPDLPANLPGERYDLWQYSAIVYGRGAWFIEQVRLSMGDEAFRRAMHDYLRRNRGQHATSDDLLRSLRHNAADPDAIDALYERWIRRPVQGKP